MAIGKPGSNQELAIITSQLRRWIRSATTRANFTCLLERMSQVGYGARIENVPGEVGSKNRFGFGWRKKR